MCNTDKYKVELGAEFSPKFDSNGLIGVIVQDIDTKAILMFAHMNKDALNATLDCGEMVYYSRSRQTLWHKGKTSGSTQRVVTLKTDCDQDVILAMVKPTQAGACHNGYESCFYRDIEDSKTLSFNETVHCFDPSEVY